MSQVQIWGIHIAVGLHFDRKKIITRAYSTFATYLFHVFSSFSSIPSVFPQKAFVK